MFYIVLIMIIAIFLIGPDRLPKIGSGLGQGAKKLKEARTNYEKARGTADRAKEVAKSILRFYFLFVKKK